MREGAGPVEVWGLVGHMPPASAPVDPASPHFLSSCRLSPRVPCSCGEGGAGAQRGDPERPARPSAVVWLAGSRPQPRRCRVPVGGPERKPPSGGLLRPEPAPGEVGEALSLPALPQRASPARAPSPEAAPGPHHTPGARRVARSPSVGRVVAGKRRSGLPWPPWWPFPVPAQSLPRTRHWVSAEGFPFSAQWVTLRGGVCKQDLG